nr:hypothetical protein [Helicobacter pametensis]
MAMMSLSKSSLVKITSEVSLLRSLPPKPIEIPTSALESTGASLIPSPTKADFSCLCD